MVLDHQLPCDEAQRVLFEGVEAARGNGSVIDEEGEVVLIDWEIIGMK